MSVDGMVSVKRQLLDGGSELQCCMQSASEQLVGEIRGVSGGLLCAGKTREVSRSISLARKSISVPVRD